MRKIVGFVCFLFVCVNAVFAQNNRVVFDNQSGEPALVKLIGPTKADVEVASGAKAGTEASAGRYIIKARYGTPGKYHYAKGEEFEVKGTTTTRSETIITLHKVVAGNYESNPISEAEFGVPAVRTTVPTSTLPALLGSGATPELVAKEYDVIDALMLGKAFSHVLERVESIPGTDPDRKFNFVIPSGGEGKRLIYNFTWHRTLTNTVTSFRVLFPYANSDTEIRVSVGDRTVWNWAGASTNSLLSPEIEARTEDKTPVRVSVRVSQTPGMFRAGGVTDIMLVRPRDLKQGTRP